MTQHKSGEDDETQPAIPLAMPRQAMTRDPGALNKCIELLDILAEGRQPTNEQSKALKDMLGHQVPTARVAREWREMLAEWRDHIQERER